jgi:hypothetical protein
MKKRTRQKSKTLLDGRDGEREGGRGASFSGERGHPGEKGG